MSRSTFQQRQAEAQRAVRCVDVARQIWGVFMSSGIDDRVAAWTRASTRLHLREAAHGLHHTFDSHQLGVHSSPLASSCIVVGPLPGDQRRRSVGLHLLLQNEVCRAVQAVAAPNQYQDGAIIHRDVVDAFVVAIEQGVACPVAAPSSRRT